MQLVGTDTDLGTQSILIAIRKTRRGIHHHGTGVHLTQEAAYNGLLKAERRAIHQQVGEALERLFPERIEARCARKPGR